MIKYYVSVYVNNQWKFINVVFALSSNEAINKVKQTQPLYVNNQWKAEQD